MQCDYSFLNVNFTSEGVTVHPCWLVIGWNGFTSRGDRSNLHPMCELITYEGLPSTPIIECNGFHRFHGVHSNTL